MMRPAVLVIDMIVDFTTGRYGSEAARKIRAALAQLLNRARRKKIPVIFCQDAHVPGDPELKVWGSHGMFGTRGAKTDRTLSPLASEPVVPKHTFNAFFGTHLDELLGENEVDTLILTGVATEICVQQTAAEAFYRGYRIVIPKDGTAGLNLEAHEGALRYMARTFGAKVTKIEALALA